MSAVEIPQDRFTLRPLVVPTAIALFVGTTFSFFQLFAGAALLVGFLSVILGGPALLIWLVMMLVRLVKAVWRRMWKRVAAQLVISVGALPLIAGALYVGTYVHFGLSYPYYAVQVRLSPDGGTKPISFYWGASGFAGAARTDRWLVYDPTNETAGRPKVSQDPEDPFAWYEVEHLLGRFYLVERLQ